jgi:hypothetical protein
LREKKNRGEEGAKPSPPLETFCRNQWELSTNWKS